MTSANSKLDLDLDDIRGRLDRYYALNEEGAKQRLGNAWAAAVGFAASLCAGDVEQLLAELSKARDELERLRTGETCLVGQPAACGDFHTAGHCVRLISPQERKAVDALAEARGAVNAARAGERRRNISHILTRAVINERRGFHSAAYALREVAGLIERGEFGDVAASDE